MSRSKHRSGLLIVLALTLLASVGCQKQLADPAGSGDQSSAEPEQPPTVTVPAQVGAGAKGHSYGGDMITEPLSAYWRAREMIAYEIEVRQGLLAFQAENPNLEGPASHEQFMTDVIEKYHIELPELPANHRYLYDPESGTLMIEKPANE